ncbi:hypothetical protein DFQ10_102114 [Winogradskyella eximia]|uniref:Ion channel n=1 Tax=Winogradskyella eximia TaxID=262006 RepID=A0A3D9H8F4_9FLAO|nr:hypothetical protein [Winogradskyella eximia]RED45246.1 hypothetical protein DFQ10_102114 [Winogradskyella eximia]
MPKKQKTTNHPFEHRNQQILPFKKFVVRVLKYLLFSFVFILFSLGIGTVGYHHYAHISWVDAFYNASLILTGMGPVNEMPTDNAKLFASFYALFSGIAFLSTVGVIFAPIAHRLLHILHVKEED